MKTRVDKYTDEETELKFKSRAQKNSALYSEIKDTTALENLSIGDNERVILENQNQIDIDKIKELLEKNYQEPVRKRSKIVQYEEEQSEIDLEKTREYDINTILENARREKQTTYEEDKFKKVRDTQYDILKNLDLESPSEGIVVKEKTKEELLELINTINLNEYQNKEESNNSETKVDPLDLFSDLKGDDDTVVVEAQDFVDDKTMVQENKGNKEDEENDFYTKSITFDKDDFADFDDIDGGNKVGSIIIKILVVLIFLAAISGVVIFLNDFLKLGWF